MILATVMFGQTDIKTKHYLIENEVDNYAEVHVLHGTKISEIVDILDKTIGVEYCYDRNKYSVSIFIGKMYDKQKVFWNINANLAKYFKEKK